MNRRQFVYTVAATAAAAATKRHDLIIKGGRVIDPSRKLNAIGDVAIADGHVAAVGAHIPHPTPRKRSTRATSWSCPG
jgi:predicted amidohydrolase